MIVAALQTDIAWLDPAENFRRADTLAAEAVAAGARLLVLPEMFATGFSMDADLVSGLAGDTRVYLADLARRHAVWVAGGLAEAGAARPRNVCIVVAPDGAEAALYHKIHPFSLGGEDRHYEGGRTVVTVDVEGVRVTPLICYDLRFPEVFRAAAAATDLFVIVANWPGPRRLAWRALLTARAIENQAYVLGVNRVGEGDGLVYGGDSTLVSPLGETLSARAEEAAVVSGDVDAATVDALRRRFPVLADRRPDVYAELERRA